MRRDFLQRYIRLIGFVFCFSLFFFKDVSAQKKYALIVGVTDKSDVRQGGLGKSNDAFHVQEGLKRLGWDKDNIMTLDNEFNSDTGEPLPDESDPTLKNVKDGLKWLLKQDGDADVVLFHFAGHSDSKKNEAEKDGYDEGMKLTDGTLWDDEFTTLVKQFCNKSKSVIFQIDACWSEGMIDNVDNIIKDCPNIHFGYSSVESELSKTKEGCAMQGHAYTAEKWVDGLNGSPDEGFEPEHLAADKNKDKKITLEELEEFAKENVKKKSGGKQNPGFKDGNPKKDVNLNTCFVPDANDKNALAIILQPGMLFATNHKFHDNYGNGIIYSFGIEYFLPKGFSVTAEMSNWKKHDYETFYTGTIDNTLTLNPLFFSIHYNFILNKNFQPYVGFGIGMDLAKLTIDSTLITQQQNMSRSAEFSQNNLGFKSFLGSNYRIFPRISLNSEIAYYYFPKALWSLPANRVVISLGLKYFLFAGIINEVPCNIK